MKKANLSGEYKIMYTKQSNGSYTTRMSVPNEMLLDIGVSPLDRNVKVTRVEKGILITKLN